MAPHGRGEPFAPRSRDEQIREYMEDLEGLNDELKKRLVSALCAIRPEDWKLVQQLVERIARKQDAGAGDRPAAPPAAQDRPGLSPDEQELVRQYRENRNLEERSSASNAG